MLSLMDSDAVAAVLCDFKLNSQLFEGSCRCHYVRATQYFIHLMDSIQ